MKQCDADREDEQRPAGEQDANARRLIARRIRVGVVQPAREIVVDRALGDREDADEARDRHGAEQVEYHGRAEPIGGEAREPRRDRVAGVIEGFVAADPPGEGGMAEDSERHRGDRRRKDHGSGLRDALRDCDRSEARKQRQRQRGERHHDGGDRHDHALRPRDVDQRARGRLRNDAGDGRNRHHQADAGLVPMLLGQEIDGEIGAEPVADVGEEEIGCIQRTAGSSLIVFVGHEAFLPRLRLASGRVSVFVVAVFRLPVLRLRLFHRLQPLEIGADLQRMDHASMPGLETIATRGELRAG